MRWLDIGCGGIFEEGFHYIDIFPEGLVRDDIRRRYRRVDIAKASDAQLEEIGRYDLVRMQHTLEHLTYEEGGQALRNCVKILDPGGFILITTPDLRVHIERYANGLYREWDGFQTWAERRVPRDAPDSFYFSIFAHSMDYEPHKWCYDFDGLAYQLRTAGGLRDIRELMVTDELAEVPFTHNRPEEDVCVLARKS